MNQLGYFTKGLILGTTAITPGISFGTMALLLHIYEPSIKLFTQCLTLAFWKDAKIRKESITFFLPILLGVLISVYVGARLVLWVFTTYIMFVQMFFVGIIVASIFTFYMQYIHFTLVNKKNRNTLLFYLFCIAVGYAMVYFLGSHGEVTSNIDTQIPSTFNEYISCFFIGMLAASVGLIPGMSGSYVLLLIGYYSRLLAIISSHALVPLIWFISGVGVGVVITAFFIRFLLSKYSRISYLVIFGIIIASLQMVFPLQALLGNNFSIVVTWGGSLLIFCMGFATSWYSTKLQKSNT